MILRYLIYVGNSLSLNVIFRLLFLVALSVIAACQSSSSTSNFNAEINHVKICSGFGCEYIQRLDFSSSDVAHIRSVLNNQIRDSATERTAISNLVAWKEILAQRRLNMRQDTRLSYQRHVGIRGQMDCVDESNNTLAFLKFLDHKGLLKFHKPMRIGNRGFLFDGRYPHKTAVVTDENGIKWAIDSWKKDGGEPPQIVKYATWRIERGSEYR